MCLLLSAGPYRRLPRLSGSLKGSVQTRSKSSIVTAWGAYVGHFAKPSVLSGPSLLGGSELEDGSLEEHACATPVQISLNRLFRCGSDQKTSIAVDAMGAGVRHALVSTHSLSGDRFESHLAGFGLNRCRQLGKKGSDTPSIVTNVPGKVLQIACGREHSAMVVEKKDRTKVVMVCGSNSYGQLGIGDTHKLQEAAIPKQTAGLEQEEYLIPASGLVEVAALKDMLRSDEMPVRVQCGMDHTVVLTSLGRVFAMGWGSDGQLGAGPDSTVCHDRPVQVFGLDKAPIVDISSSTDFTLALSVDGRLFYWGNAEYGQCMIGKKIDQVLAPLEIPFTDGTIVKIAAGGCHALVLLSDGRVYGCGYGAIGMGADTASSLTPSLVKGIRGIGHIAASTDRCLALDSQNNVYSWGLGNHAGRLGNGTVFSNLYAPTRLDISPKHVQPAFMALGNDIALLASNA
ncbi:hypothetical protein LPJ72_001187 [Coemansia sp. Benny D160-2]|nr:hypothetical protein LPJ72_001187 [Coemansia sp. Benny D160-2]